MTRADRICIKVALLPVVAYIAGLLGLMLVREMTGSSPLPTGSAACVQAASVAVTFAAILGATLLRNRLARSPD